MPNNNFLLANDDDLTAALKKFEDYREPLQTHILHTMEDRMRLLKTLNQYGYEIVKIKK